jgi:hypothetical protein
MPVSVDVRQRELLEEIKKALGKEKSFILMALLI